MVPIQVVHVFETNARVSRFLEATNGLDIDRVRIKRIGGNVVVGIGNLQLVQILMRHLPGGGAIVGAINATKTAVCLNKRIDAVGDMASAATSLLPGPASTVGSAVVGGAKYAAGRGATRRKEESQADHASSARIIGQARTTRPAEASAKGDALLAEMTAKFKKK